MKNPAYYMSLALKEAQKALLEDETPIGCVIVKDDKVIARAHNKRETKNLVISHAEIEAITKANKKLKSWRLVDCDLYVTVEPCIMCGGAIIQSRIRNVYYGAGDPKGGAFGGSINILGANNINHRPNIIGGILAEECAIIIKNYFKNKRK
ncbi:MAG: nucleoside deaminase [Erysipelotrichaceae bacterium]|nr:nucleoside deaminase [Erysipelotrichaceae bacterium]